MRVSPWWCAECSKEDGDRLYGFLSTLPVGNLFIYKVRMTVNGIGYADEIKYEYAVMKRTACKTYFDEGNTARYYYDDMTAINRGNFMKFYDFSDFIQIGMRNGEHRVFHSLDDPELIMRLAAAGTDVKDLPVFEIEYDDRTVIPAANDESEFFILF